MRSAWVSSRIVEDTDLLSVQLNRLKLSFDPDFVVVPLARRAGGYLIECFEIGAIVLAINCARPVYRHVAELIDLHFEAEIVCNVGTVVVVFRFRVWKA